MIAIAVGGAVVFMILGMPIVFCLGAAGMLALAVASPIPMIVAAQQMISQIDNFTLLAVPFFILAGTIMEHGGISVRMVRFAHCVVGHLPGGLAMVCVFSSMIFAGVSGSTSADAAAVGGVLVPAMIARGYDRGFVASLQASASTMGPLIPPSSLAIIYAALTNVSVARLFLSGIVAGLMICVALMVVTYFYAKRLGYAADRRATWRETWEALRGSAWALLVPVIILGGILSGVFTTVESGAITVAYALFVALVVYRELGWRELPGVVLRAGLTTAMVMIVISAAGLFSWILASHNLPTIVAGLLEQLADYRLVALFIMIIGMLLLGCVMEIVPAAMIMVPVLFPISRHLGFDDVHFGFLMMMTMALGAITPPSGVTLFITMGLAGVPLSGVNRFIWPMIGILFAILAMCALVPPTATLIPNLILGVPGPAR